MQLLVLASPKVCRCTGKFETQKTDAAGSAWRPVGSKLRKNCCFHSTLKTGKTMSQGIGFISCCCEKIPCQKKQCKGKKLIFTGIWSSWSHAVKGRKSLNACVLASAQFLCYTYPTWDPQPREWSPLQWSGFLTSVNQDNLSQTYLWATLI